ncbi:helix-turn-helix domain-containing protein [Bombilactobacillus thymidiniphilus]|uniref:Helix-turn-helix domain-containing protein n=1 Tax=Bombilactobacillus thymidiniphilus TaxID=2923363 RepID=A0ABY4PCN3_9LACO|nr:S24 family peptidase [Bombilactobacillus thymidiniphilus]UQS83518.1 helix-turn-helix domain-containing protein [Bombilactobacillus thymidiniphilus]
MDKNISAKEFGIKLKQIRKDKGFSLRQASQQSAFNGLGAISPSYWSLVENGERNIPKRETLTRFAKGLRISENEILKIAGYIPDEKTYLDFDSLVAIPIVGSIKAGPNGIAQLDFDGYASVTPSDIDRTFNYYWLKVSGKSMIGDGIYEGDLALIKQTSFFNNGDICAVIVDGEEGTLKHVTKNNDSIVLTASNPEYPPRIFSQSSDINIEIAGKLVEIKRKFN